MKKFVFILLALFIAVPMVSNAGSVTSRWDVTIGGFVKADFGWASKGVNADFFVAPRESVPNNQNLSDEYGAWYGAAGETRINMLIKGPDTPGGAKTSAFIEGEFSGGLTGNSATSPYYGLARLRHAFMKMDWGNVDLLIGQTWFDFGTMFADVLGRAEFTVYNRGDRQPQIRLTHRFAKDFQYFVGLYVNQDIEGTGNLYPSDYSRSMLPNLFGEFAYVTESCGKIGAEKLYLGIGGVFGQQRFTTVDTSGAKFQDELQNVWAAAVRGFIPIIPEKQGNKTNALFLRGHLMYGQNFGLFGQNVGAIRQNYVSVATANSVKGASVPTGMMSYAQLGWWATDKLNMNAIWGYLKNNLSNVYKDIPRTTIDNQQQWSFTMLYDVNPAIRFGAEYTHINTAYATVGIDTYGASTTGPGGLLTASTATGGPVGRSGSLDAVRMTAWYFF